MSGYTDIGNDPSSPLPEPISRIGFYRKNVRAGNCVEGLEMPPTAQNTAIVTTNSTSVDTCTSSAQEWAHQQGGTGRWGVQEHPSLILCLSLWLCSLLEYASDRDLDFGLLCINTAHIHPLLGSWDSANGIWILFLITYQTVCFLHFPLLPLQYFSSMEAEGKN